MYRIWVASSSVPMRESMALGMELPGAGCKYPIVLCLTVVQLVVRLLKSFFFSTWMNNSACSPTGMAMYVCARFSIQSSKLKILFFLNICLNKT